MTTTTCNFCNAQNCTKRCSQCHETYYCNRQCQINHWKIHKKVCKIIKQEKNNLSKSKSGINTNINTNTNVRSNCDENHVFTNEEAIKKYGEKHCKVIDGILHFAGYKIEPQKMLDALINNGKAFSNAFKKLSIEDQAKVMIGTKKIYISNEIKDNELKEQYTGSSGKRCDGCHWSRKDFEDENDSDDLGWEFSVCPRCKYTCCESCEVHHSKGTCYCKNSNFGHPYHQDINQRNWYQGGYW